MVSENPYSSGAELKYDNGNLNVEWSHLLVGSGYNAEVGYVRRTGVKSFQPQLGYTFYPKKLKFIIRHGPQVQLEQLHADGSETATDRAGQHPPVRPYLRQEVAPQLRQPATADTQNSEARPACR